MRSSWIALALVACARGQFVDGNPPADDFQPTGAQPVFGPTVSLADSPPPITGGTLELSSDGSLAVVADSDRDEIHVVLLAQPLVKLRTIALGAHDEPSRMALDPQRAHVILRGAGQVLTFDLGTGEIFARRSPCARPRGVAWDARGDVIHVACASGELVTMPASGGEPSRVLHTALDLRDVAVLQNELYVGTRAGRVVKLDDDGNTIWNVPVGLEGRTVLRRMRPTGDAIGVLFQTASGFLPRTLNAPRPYYGTDCSPIVVTRIGRLDAVTGSMTLDESSAPGLIVDFAGVADVVAGRPSPSINRFVVAAPGNGYTPGRKGAGTLDEVGGCGKNGAVAGDATSGEVVAVAALGSRVVMFHRQPAALTVIEHKTGAAVRSWLTLSSVSREDSGHAIFHANTGATIACASCHVEGDADGIVWSMPDPRQKDSTSQVTLRTQSLLGTIEGTAPYHWLGDVPTIPALADDVYTHGMNGSRLDAPKKDALRAWLERLHAPPRGATTDSATRGAALFSGKANCASCHAGEKMTDNTAHDVGAFLPLQTPSLVGLGSRSPLMHDGCAKTIRDRFSQDCRADKHGFVPLTADEMNDLVSFLNGL